MSPGTRTVVDEARNHRFVHIEDGIEAQLTYRTTPGKLILLHTEVPEALAGSIAIDWSDLPR